MGPERVAVSVLGVALVLAGCEAEGSVVVDLRTDYVAGVEFVVVHTELTTPAGASLGDESLPVFRGSAWVTGGRVAEIGGLEEGAAMVRVELLSPTGSVFVERTARTEIAGRVAVTVVIARNCDADPCRSCSADAECTSAVACARGSCREGSCLFAGDSTGCAAGQYCNPDEGCLALPDLDAGVPPPDAGDCGDEGELCCEADLCHSGLCADGTCHSCGAAGEPCCADGACDAGQVCTTSSTCVPCGGVGEACCDGMMCTPGRVCQIDGVCADCGAAGQPCCAGDTCDRTDLACEGGVCASCGEAIGARCCPGGGCDEGTCVSGVCRP